MYTEAYFYSDTESSANVPLGIYSGHDEDRFVALRRSLCVDVR